MAVRTSTATVDRSIHDAPVDRPTAGDPGSRRARRRGGSHRHRPQDDRYAFPRWLRRAGIAWVAVTTPGAGLLAPAERGEAAFLTSLTIVSAVCAAPGLAVAVVAIRRVAATDRRVWRFWALMFGQSSVSGAFVVLHGVDDWSRVGRLAPISVVVSLVFMVVGNTLIMRRRSGQRAAWVDAIDLVMATIALVVPVALVTAETIVDSPHAWFNATAALWGIGGVYGALVALVVGSRLRPGDRGLAWLGGVLTVTVVATTATTTALGVRGFTDSPRPCLALHALCVSMSVLFFLWSRRRSSPGLDRLPPQEQARRHPLTTVLVLVVTPVIALETWLRRDDDWVLATAVCTTLALLALSSVRHLLSGRETTRLYGAVERAAGERGELLAEVMAHLDADRHHVASHLHRQAVSLYTAMVTFTGALDRPSPNAPSAAGLAAERMREDLARRVDGLRQVAMAVEPLTRGPRARRLAAPIRAYVGSLYGDAPRPDLTVEVDPELDLDWTTEAIILRIVQEATHNVWRHAGATTLAVTIRPAECAIVVEIVDDGVGFDSAAAVGPAPEDPAPDGEGHGRGIATMRAVAGFVEGRIDVASAPGRGTRVRAVVGPAAPAAPKRPHLRLVAEDA